MPVRSRLARHDAWLRYARRNQSAAFNALRTGAVDAAELNRDNLRAAATVDALRIARTPENGLRAFYRQTAAAPTDDVRVRRAIAYALDLPGLSRAWHDLYPAARSVLPAPVRSWHSVLPPPYPHDLARAGRELDAAGWHLRGTERAREGRPLALVIALNATLGDVIRIAVIAQQQLSRLGISVTVKRYAAHLFASPAGPLRTGRFALTPAARIGGSDPEESLNLLCRQARDGGENYARYCSPRVDAYSRISRARRTTCDGSATSTRSRTSCTRRFH